MFTVCPAPTFPHRTLTSGPTVGLTYRGTREGFEAEGLRERARRSVPRARAGNVRTSAAQSSSHNSVAIILKPDTKLQLE